MADSTKITPMISTADRVRGAILGLCAGDRNGGPIRMAVRLGESILENKGYNEADVIKRWLNWHRGPPHDTERSYDTGATFQRVFTALELTGDHKQKANSMDSFGINAAHRAVPIACFAGIPDSDVPEISVKQSVITHTHILAFETAKAFNIICRSLINGSSLQCSLKLAKSQVTADELKKVLTMETRPQAHLSTGGESPLTLEAALWFIINCNGFNETLYRSLEFAGEANYCPVLVGTLAGIIYGCAQITETDISHKETKRIVDRVKQLAENFAKDWPQ